LRSGEWVVDWLSQAKALPYGQKTKIKCCASDRSCIISHDAKGYRAWCFRCDPQTPIRFVPHGLRSISELSKIASQASTLMRSSEVRMPSDATPKLSSLGMGWLLRGGLSLDLSRKYGIMESPSLGRIALPIQSMSGKLSAVLLRSLSKDIKPKYLLKSENTHEATVFHSRRDTILPSAYAAGTTTAFDLVLTEDVLSAIRTGRHCASAALLGTAFDSGRMAAVLHPRAPSVEWYRDETAKLRLGVWLDPDKAGRAATRNLLAALRLQGHHVVDIRTERDPKYYSDNEIRSILVRHCSS
jgi:hypothetical protein